MNMEIVKYIYEKLCMARFEGHNYVLVNLNKSLGEIYTEENILTSVMYLKVAYPNTRLVKSDIGLFDNYQVIIGW